jgi:hypothetical protein
MAVTPGPGPVSQATAERIFLLCLMAASAALFYETFRYPSASRAYPAALLVLLFCCCAVALTRNLRRPGDSAASFFDHAPRFALALGLLVAYTALLEFVGYYTTSAAMIVLLPTLFGYRAWRVIGATAVLYLGFVWVIFNLVFQREMAREFFMPWILGY